jgi:ADP-L-glycero-D-manno-heptose 6-epimerase
MENNSAYMMQANYQFSNDLCTIADAQKVPFIYASSAAVYGRSKAFEEKRINELPLNVFAYSKFLCDQYKPGHIESKTHSALGYRPPAHQTQVPQLLQNQPILLQ